jgi:hypothetical protein
MISCRQREGVIHSLAYFDAMQASAEHTGSTFCPKEIRNIHIILEDLWDLAGLKFVRRRKSMLLVGKEPLYC